MRPFSQSGQHSGRTNLPVVWKVLKLGMQKGGRGSRCAWKLLKDPTSEERRPLAPSVATFWLQKLNLYTLSSNERVVVCTRRGCVRCTERYLHFGFSTEVRSLSIQIIATAWTLAHQGLRWVMEEYWEMYLELIARVSTQIILFVFLYNCAIMKCQPKLTVQLHLVYKHVMSHIERLLHYDTCLLGSSSFRREKLRY